jgi:hypothetical protein
VEEPHKVKPLKLAHHNKQLQNKRRKKLKPQKLKKKRLTSQQEDFSVTMIIDKQ